MRNLLKADFFTLFKSKILYVLLGICVAFPIISVLTDLGLAKILVALAEEGGMDMSSMFLARSIMFSNFSLTNNIGLVIPIFAGIMTMRDIKNGTVRNKVISGQNRTKIYLSHLITSITLCVAMSLISFLLLCGTSLIFFKYGVAFNGAEFWNFCKCLIIGLLAFAYVASVSTFFALVTKSTPMTIIFTLVLVIALGLISGIEAFLPDKYNFIIYMIPIFASSTVAGSAQLNNEIFFYGLGSFIVFGAINSIGGILLFNYIDLK